MTALQRLLQLLPPWFGSVKPVITALLSGIGTALDNFQGLLTYVKLQLRIRTATDGFLDLIAGDYVGERLTRNPGESDNSFRSRVLTALFAPVVTRPAILARLKTLTGRDATIFEPGNPEDTGGYTLGGCGYGVAGGWGSVSMPCQFFIYPKRPSIAGIPYVGGYGSSVGGYSTASQAEYADIDSSTQGATDTAIYALIDKIRAAGVTAWVQISN